MIPIKYASKIGVCDVTVHGTSVKVRLVDIPDLVSLGLSELKSEMGNNKVVGFMVKSSDSNVVQMMVLCVKNRCLIIQACGLPQCLIDFLEDGEICFVGPAMEETIHMLCPYKEIYQTEFHRIEKSHCLNFRGLDVGDLAAKVILDPTLLSKNRTASKPIAEHMQSIADKVGLTLEKDTSDHAEKASIDLAAQAFSREQMKHLVADVYASYLIAAKLFDSL